MDWRIVRALLLSGSVLCGTAQHLAYAGPAVATKAHQRRGTEHLSRACAGGAAAQRLRAARSRLAIDDGKRGEYTASIRCVPSIVFFVMSGPSPAEANRLLDSVFQGF